MANMWGNNGNSERLNFEGVPKSLQMVAAAMKLKDLLLGRKVMTNLDSILKSRDIICQHTPSSQGYGFASRHAWI